MRLENKSLLEKPNLPTVRFHLMIKDDKSYLLDKFFNIINNDLHLVNVIYDFKCRQSQYKVIPLTDEGEIPPELFL